MSVRSSLKLNRLRVLQGARVAYDEQFHSGVNIIHGENGSGKSTIADFIFYVLGGEFQDWKDAASKCSEVQAEIETAVGILTLRRRINGKLTPIQLHFGSWESSKTILPEQWVLLPIRRQLKQISLSQVLFQLIGIPEAQSDGASNVTMHQMLRLMYSDQRTLATRLFRFELFDKQTIREAVGDLLCGINSYDSYEIALKVRELESEFDKVKDEYSALISALSSDESFRSKSFIYENINKLETERSQVIEEIKTVDTLVDNNQTQQFALERKKSYDLVTKEREQLTRLADSIREHEIEIVELKEFLQYLDEAQKKVGLAQETARIIGDINFTHCPECLEELNHSNTDTKCYLCGTERNADANNTRYSQIQVDIRLQIRESSQLLHNHEAQLIKSKTEYREARKRYEQGMATFTVNYDISSSPREKFLAHKNQRIGEINGEIQVRLHALKNVERLEALSARKSELQQELTRLKDRWEALNAAAERRRMNALRSISKHSVELLRKDLERQGEFEEAKVIKVDFTEDKILVDDKMNFAESSNVYLKNATLFGLFVAACYDNQFFHPRFILMDNMEDKGMEQTRSHHFQRLVVETAAEIDTPHQIIYTTSMLNPDLDQEQYVVGRHYTHNNKTLNIDLE